MADVKIEDFRIEVKKAIKGKAVEFLHEAGGELVSQTARNSRVDTGQTKGSYEYKVDEDNLVCTVGSPLQNAIWEEFGTGEKALHGDGRKGGWFYVDRHGHGWFTLGKSPNQPLKRAFDSLKSTITQEAERRFKKLNDD